MDNNKLGRMGRRRFMETLAGAGVSATTLAYLEQDELSDLVDDPEEEVPYVAGWTSKETEPGQPPEREEFYDTIEREEWERRQTALDARSRINNMLQEELDGRHLDVSYAGVDQSPTDFGVKVYNREFDLDVEDIEEVIPTEITGTAKTGAERIDIPVIIDEATSEKLQYEHNNFDSVPGGQRIVGTSIGTLTGRYLHPEHGPGLITAGHVLGEDETYVSEVTGPDQDEVDPLGRARDVTIEDDQHLDYGFIDLDVEANQENSASPYITDPNNAEKQLTIDGVYSDEAIENNAGNTDWPINMQGQTTEDRKTAFVGEALENDDNETTGVFMNKMMLEGDSGGPIFFEQDGNAYMLGLITDRYLNNFDFGTRGTTAQTLEEELGGSIYGACEEDQ